MTESKIQQDIFIWFNNNYCLKDSKPRCNIFSVPNEAAMVVRSVLISSGVPKKLVNRVVSSIVNKMKSTGMKSGVSDLIVQLPKKVLFIELKTKTGVQSSSQKDFQETTRNLYLEYHVVRSLEEFKKIINLNLHNCK